MPSLVPEPVLHEKICVAPPLTARSFVSTVIVCAAMRSHEMGWLVWSTTDHVTENLPVGPGWSAAASTKPPPLPHDATTSNAKIRDIDLTGVSRSGGRA